MVPVNKHCSADCRALLYLQSELLGVEELRISCWAIAMLITQSRRYSYIDATFSELSTKTCRSMARGPQVAKNQEVWFGKGSVFQLKAQV